jgi:DNA-binding PadR family transcriptional regulator
VDPSLSTYLPLSESTFYVLAALREPLHGYALMQKVEAMSQGSVTIGPGTLYGAFATLEKQGLIDRVSEVERRKIYGLTDKGRQVLAEQVRRLAIMVGNGQFALSPV